nr:ABC transporter family protein [Ipomoea batatas]
MVSELAGEGAMPLPEPASHAELRHVRLQRQICRGSLLRRGVTRSKQVFLRIFSFNLLFLQFSEDRSTVLFFKSSQSWSRSVKVLSKVLISPLFAIFNLNGSVKISDRVFVNLRFIAFSCSSRSRSVESTSIVLVKKLDEDLDDDEELNSVNKVRSRRKSRTDQEVGGDLGENQPDRSLVKLVRGGQQNIVVEKVLSYCRTLMSVDGWTNDENSHIDIHPAINHSLKEGEIIRINVKNKHSAAGASMRSAAGLTSGLKTGKSKTLGLVPPLIEEILIRTIVSAVRIQKAQSHLYSTKIVSTAKGVYHVDSKFDEHNILYFWGLMLSIQTLHGKMYFIFSGVLLMICLVQ